jgi:hypothetical protein
MTLIELITQSLRKINVIGKTAAPTATMGAECLAQLNLMFPMWEEQDVLLQWYTQTDTTADYPGPEYSLQGVIGALAIAMAANYGRQVSIEAAKYADDGWQVIANAQVRRRMRPADVSHLPEGSGFRDRFNIESGW